MVGIARAAATEWINAFFMMAAPPDDPSSSRPDRHAPAE
jgi:hypothetical protein